MDRLPPPFLNAAEAAGFWGRLRRAPRSVLMLDYDGTLAPFHQDRLQAKVYPGVEECLLTLSAGSDVMLVMVTGRSASELRSILHPGIHADIWGNHGLEHLKRDGSYQLFALHPEEQSTMRSIIEEMTAAGFEEALDIKPASLAVHWRYCSPPVQAQIRSRLEAAWEGAAHRGSLSLLPFDGGLELRSVDRNKGSAVREILSHEPPGLPVAYLGDDLTDEDAFVALGDRGLSILVRPEIRASSARFWLRPPEELLVFLHDWIDAATKPLPSGPSPG